MQSAAEGCPGSSRGNPSNPGSGDDSESTCHPTRACVCQQGDGSCSASTRRGNSCGRCGPGDPCIEGGRLPHQFLPHLHIAILRPTLCPVSLNHTIVSLALAVGIAFGLLRRPCQIPFLKGSRAYLVNPGAKPIEAAIRNGRIACQGKRAHQHMRHCEVNCRVCVPTLTTTYAATALAIPAAAVD